MKERFWDSKDFDVFTIDGLENRMDALQQTIQPKFAVIGERLTSYLSAHGKGEFFPHIAKHARRTVNPPKDSWVAFAPAKRGYKALPHFQVGLWETHLFIILAVIYENPDKKGISERLTSNLDMLTSLPEQYVISGDHMKPDATILANMDREELEGMLERLKTVKKAELVLGRHLSREITTGFTEEEFFRMAEKTIHDLLPLYDIMTAKLK
ncbi:YktB family protein [Sporosarcina sp. ITBMC105]